MEPSIVHNLLLFFVYQKRSENQKISVQSSFSCTLESLILRSLEILCTTEAKVDGRIVGLVFGASSNAITIAVRLEVQHNNGDFVKSEKTLQLVWPHLMTHEAATLSHTLRLVTGRPLMVRLERELS